MQKRFQLIRSTQSNGGDKMTKEKILYKALERVIKDDYETDKYGTYCLNCNSYTPNGKTVRHNSRNCRTKHLERILAI